MGETIPNFLTPEIHSVLYRRLCCTPESIQDFHWTYHSGVTSTEDNNFYFTNLLIDRTLSDTWVSPFYHDVAGPILGQLKFNTVTRIKLNLYTNLGYHQKHGFHVDFKDDHKVLLYSLNTCNGYTEFEDGEIVKSVANQAYIFDGKRKHQSVTQTDTSISVNVNVVFN